MTILARTYFCRQKLFLAVRFLPWKNRFFPPTGKNLPTLLSNKVFAINLILLYWSLAVDYITMMLATSGCANVMSAVYILPAAENPFLLEINSWT